MRVGKVILVTVQLSLQIILVCGQSPAPALRVAAVTPATEQPQQQDPTVLLYDDFDRLPDWRSRYFEYSPAKDSFVWTPGDGLHGGAMRCQFDKGQVTA